MGASPFPVSPSHPIAAANQEELTTPFPTIQSMHNPWAQPEVIAVGTNYKLPCSPSITHALLSAPRNPQ